MRARTSASVVAIVGASLLSAEEARAAPTHVACIGDSITQGYAASSPSLDWVGDLGTLLGSGVAVQNDGVASTTMMKQSNFSYWTNGDLPAVESFVGDAGAGASVAVIVLLGANDAKDNPNGVYNWDATAPARYAADYNAMIDTLQALAPKPQVFVALPAPAFPNGLSIDDAVLKFQIVPILLEIARTRQLPIIDARTPLEGMASLFVDGVHPNDAGHMLIAQAMYQGLIHPTIPAADAGADASPAADAAATDATAPLDATSPVDAEPSNDAELPSEDAAGVDAAPQIDATIPVDAEGPAPAEGSVDAGGSGAPVAPSTGGGCALEQASPSAEAWWTLGAVVIALGLRRRAERVSSSRS